jgi:hypothetical protein
VGLAARLHPDVPRRCRARRLGELGARSRGGRRRDEALPADRRAGVPHGAQHRADCHAARPYGTSHLSSALADVTQHSLDHDGTLRAAAPPSPRVPIAHARGPPPGWRLVGGGARLGWGVGRNGVRDLVAIHGRADAPEYATCARERPAAGSRSVVRGRRGTVLLKPSNDAHRPRADAMARQQLPIAGVPSGSERRHPPPTRPRTAGRGSRRDGSSSGVVGSGWVGSFMAASLSGRSTRRLPRHTNTHAHDDRRRRENSSP